MEIYFQSELTYIFSEVIMKRNIKNKIIAGVCSGIADHFDIDALWVRLAFLLGTFCSFGIGILIYTILWVILPKNEVK